jgi:hypothetical protein
MLDACHLKHGNLSNFHILQVKERLELDRLQSLKQQSVQHFASTCHAKQEEAV